MTNVFIELDKIRNDRNNEYGNIRKNFETASDIAKIAFGIDIPPIQIMMLQACLKMARDKQKYKKDNWIDMSNYLIEVGAWLNDLNQ